MHLSNHTFCTIPFFDSPYFFFINKKVQALASSKTLVKSPVVHQLLSGFRQLQSVVRGGEDQRLGTKWRLGIDESTRKVRKQEKKILRGRVSQDNGLDFSVCSLVILAKPVSFSNC